MFSVSSLVGIGSLATAIGGLAMPAARGPVVVSPPRGALHAPVRTSGTCPKNALFVADSGAGTIDIFPLKGKNQVMCGQITGLSEPGGLATDTARHLYIVDTNNSQVLVYGGPYPPGTLRAHTRGPGIFPLGRHRLGARRPRRRFEYLQRSELRGRQRRVL